MQNNAKAKYKFSHLEKHTNTSILIIFCLQLILALIGAVQGATWSVDNEKAYYVVDMNKVKPSFSMNLLQYMGTWILIFTNFVPISLMVTLELVKFW